MVLHGLLKKQLKMQEDMSVRANVCVEHVCVCVCVCVCKNIIIIQLQILRSLTQEHKTTQELRERHRRFLCIFDLKKNETYFVGN